MAKSETDPGRESTPVALSIRQPWAALILCGKKRIEIRRWTTRRTGEIYIHAGAQPDPSRIAWRAVPKGMSAVARRRGGLVGRASIIGCRRYDSREEFVADRRLHRVPASWFVAPMFGFEFSQVELIPFIPLKGELWFFPIRDQEVVRMLREQRDRFFLDAEAR